MRSNQSSIVTLLVAGLLLGSLAATAWAQPSLDLSVKCCEIGFSADNWRLNATISLTAIEPQAPHDLTVRLMVDGEFLESCTTTLSYNPASVFCYDCEGPDCTGNSCPRLTGFNCEGVEGVCNYAAFGGCGCTWNLSLCSCWMLISDQESAVIILDPDDEIAELDETNNMLTVDLTPVSAVHEAWSSIKALYR